MLIEDGFLRNIPVSPASPEYAIRVCLFKERVLSSAAFRMVAPRIAALDAAISVKSLPVIPSSTSLLHRISNLSNHQVLDLRYSHILFLGYRVVESVLWYGCNCFFDQVKCIGSYS